MENAQTQNNEVKQSISSFELTKNSKGYSWSIKVYHEDVRTALVKAEEMNSLAKMKFEDDRRRADIKGHHEEEFAAGVL